MADTDNDTEQLHAAIAALQSQRATLGDAVLELALAPLRARLAGLQRAAGLQHRQVTVLFADVVGSTALASRLDAEDTQALLSGALQRMAQRVEAHQGRVLRFTGDGIKAAFGVDEAREDDPARAVRAGLAMLQDGHDLAREALRLYGIADFALRVGVHTGSVAVGAGVEADNTAMGAAVHIAARMEQSAPPGTLRISHDTWNQVRGLFDVEAQAPLPVKGVDAPLQTYLVRAARDRHAAGVERGLQGLHTPMVGREHELQCLQQAVALAHQTRQAQAVTLIGDAGLGKSRLLNEWRAALAREGPACQTILLRAQPDGLLRPWGLLRSLLAVQCGVADTDSAQAARDKVEQGLGAWFETDGPRQAQRIGQLAGLDFGDSPHLHGLDPRALRDEALAALLAYLQALAARGALPLLLLEDLQWADDSSLDLLQHLLKHAATLPLVLVMTARPALLLRRPGWGAPGTLLTLVPLAADHSDQLVQALLQRLVQVPVQLSALLVGQAEGNPYYMEELVRRLIDDGVITVGEPHWTLQEAQLLTLRLPGTLVGLLQARLDALPADERRAARQASVIGHVFWDDALQAVDGQAPQALPALQHAAFVRRHERSDFEGTTEHQFDHHLLHQVTYDTLLKTERREGHGAVARWLALRTQGRGAEFLAMTAEHAERAGDTALAIDGFQQAGEEAARRFANAAASAYLRRALLLLGDTDPLRRLDLLNDLGRLADLVGDRALQEDTQQESADLLERHPDARRLARLLVARALLADRRSDAALSERHARLGFDTAQACGAAQWAAMAQGQLAWLHIAKGDFAAADQHIATGLPWAARIEFATVRAETEAQLLTLSGMALMHTHRLHPARDTLLGVLSRGQTLGKVRLQLGALDNLWIVASYLGHWEEAASWAERHLALAQVAGSPLASASALHHLTRTALAQGQAALALPWATQCLSLVQDQGDLVLQAATFGDLVRLHLGQGDVQAAWNALAGSATVQQQLPQAAESLELRAWGALCTLRMGQPDAARATVNTLLGAPDGAPNGAPPVTPGLLNISARWACQQVLAALPDARAAPLLDQLLADVQARAAALTEAADCARLIQAVPDFRAIVAAHRQQAAPPADVHY